MCNHAFLADCYSIIIYLEIVATKDKMITVVFWCLISHHTHEYITESGLLGLQVSALQFQDLGPLEQTLISFNYDHDLPFIWFVLCADNYFVI